MSEDQYDPQMRYTEPETKVIYNNVAFNEMEFSDSFKELPMALAKFKEKLDPTVPFDAKNPHFRSDYATLDACLNAASKLLGNYGIAIVQMPTDDLLINMMTHSSGEWMRFVYTMQIKEKTAQGRGSALTYARRYCYQAMVGLAPGNDDDGEKATEQDKEEKPKSTRSKASRKPSEQAKDWEKEKKEKEKQVNKEFKGAMKDAFEFDHNTKTEELVDTVLETFPGSEVVESSPAADPPAEYKPDGIAKILGLQIPRQKTAENIEGLSVRVTKEFDEKKIDDAAKQYLMNLIDKQRRELNA
jgi:hypothetical protein